jgi:hypothetical protein
MISENAETFFLAITLIVPSAIEKLPGGRKEEKGMGPFNTLDCKET